MSGRIRLAAAVCVLLLASGAQASDGVIEINHARAVAGGVTPSDAADYPVAIDSPGSYRLTGNLVVPDQNTDAIVVDADDVTIDLGGFSILGTAGCSGTPGSISCSGGGTGNGIHATAGSDGTVIRNGTIRGMGNYGIEVREAAWIDGVRVEHCASSGIRAADDSLVTDGRIRWIGGLGVFGVSGVVGMRGNRIALTGGFNQSGGASLDGNSCDDGTCRTVPARLYYLTPTTVTGSGVLTACAPGFHEASLMELASPSALHYDTTRGETADDAGSGPPATVFGWVRTGGISSGSSNPGSGNCNLWTSPSPGDSGSTIKATFTWDSAADESSPWIAQTSACHTLLGVWCIQD